MREQLQTRRVRVYSWLERYQEQLPTGLGPAFGQQLLPKPTVLGEGANHRLAGRTVRRDVSEIECAQVANVVILETEQQSCQIGVAAAQSPRAVQNSHLQYVSGNIDRSRLNVGDPRGAATWHVDLK